MLKSPQQIAALMTPKQRKPPQWFHSLDEFSPEMTAAPDFWRGCVLFVPFFDARGIELISGDIVNVGSLAAGNVATQQGKAAESTSGTGFNYRISLSDRARNITQGPHTFMFYGLIEPGQSVVQPLGFGDAVTWCAINAGSAEIHCQWDDDATKVGVETTFDPTDGVIRQYVGRSTATDYEVVINGNVENSSPIEDRFTIGQLALDMEIGGMPWSNTANTPSVCLYTAVWERALSDVELKVLAIDPFVMLRPGGF